MQTLYFQYHCKYLHILYVGFSTIFLAFHLILPFNQAYLIYLYDLQNWAFPFKKRFTKSPALGVDFHSQVFGERIWNLNLYISPLTTVFPILVLAANLWSPVKHLSM